MDWVKPCFGAFYLIKTLLVLTFKIILASQYRMSVLMRIRGLKQWPKVSLLFPTAEWSLSLFVFPPDRLRDTLIHEVCHAATWLINGVRDGHGRFWRFYANKAAVIHPELPVVTRCHSYEINYKYTYECVRCKATWVMFSSCTWLSVDFLTCQSPVSRNQGSLKQWKSLDTLRFSRAHRTSVCDSTFVSR